MGKLESTGVNLTNRTPVVGIMLNTCMHDSMSSEDTIWLFAMLNHPKLVVLNNIISIHGRRIP